MLSDDELLLADDCLVLIDVGENAFSKVPGLHIIQMNVKRNVLPKNFTIFSLQDIIVFLLRLWMDVSNFFLLAKIVESFDTF